MKGKIISLLVGGLLLMGSNALAISIVSLLDTNTPTLLSDNSAEYLINAGGATDTTLDVGDRLRGMFTIGSIEVGSDTTAIGAGTAYSELTGIFDIQVAEKIELPEIGVPYNRFLYRFEAFAGFATELEDLLGYAPGTLAGTMIAAFEDSAQNYSRLETGALTTEEDLIDTAKDGTYLWSFGFLGLDGEGWTGASISDDIGAFTAPGASNGGLFNYGLNVIDNDSLVVFGDVATIFGGTADLSGSGSLISPAGFVTPFDTFDNIDITINPNVVPEPSTLILLGAGLAGIGITVRNRKRKS
jgi:hypothetical protein